MHIIINKNHLTYKKFKVKCALGKKGIGIKKKEGDLITPIGTFRIKSVLFRKDRIKSFKTKLKKIVIKRNMGWCDDPKSKQYNQLIKIPTKYSHEKLFIKENIYDMLLVLDYNMNPIKKNKGSAIFIHIAKKKYSKTKGCIAIKKIHFLKIVQDLNIKSKVKISNQK